MIAAMNPIFATQIVNNLKILDTDGINASLLPEEKFMYCGRELIATYSLKTGKCGRCARFRVGKYNRLPPRSLFKHELPNKDFNKGHGEQFYHAFDAAFELFDLELLHITRGINGNI